MQVELTVYGESGRGAYLKASPAGAVTKAATGTCDPQETAEVLGAFPGASDAGGGSPNGQPIDDPQSVLFASSLARLKVGHFGPTVPQEGWALTVIRKLP